MRKIFSLLCRTALSVASTLFAAFVSASAVCAAPFAFGITDGGDLYQVDIATKSSARIFTQTLTTSFAQPNALAYDTAGGNLYYRNANNGSLYRYNIAGQTQTSIMTGTAIGFSGDDAAFFADSYWFISGNTLVRVSNLGSTNNVASFSLGTGVASLAFGDIAITGNGILYGHTSNSQFFRANIAALATAPTGGSATGFTLDTSTNTASLQLAFSTDASSPLLYGHNFSGTGADDRWYTVDYSGDATSNPGFGNATPILGWKANDASFRDIAGAGFLPAVVPEPGTFALALPGLGVIGAVVLRRRK